MLHLKQLHPDAEPGTGGTANPKPNNTSAIPAADVDFMDVSKAVAAAWQADPDIRLKWKKSGEFTTDVQNYEISISTRKASGSLRPGQTLTLKQMDVKMDEAVKEVKIYIDRKFKSAGGTAQFARYGIVKEGDMYRLSRDRNNRKEALKLMVDAIAADGFGAEEYGTPFWSDMQTNYSAALSQAGNTTGDVSEKVATKNQQKAAITKVMKALQKVLQVTIPILLNRCTGIGDGRRKAIRIRN
jgi:hypothetical protein